MILDKTRTINTPSVTVSVTLLLRSADLEAFLTAVRRRGIAQGTYLRQLVEEHTLLTFQNRQLQHDRARTCYQPAHRDYIRHNLKVSWRVWAALQALARGLGVSTCCLVAILIAVDNSRWGGVPTGRVIPEFNTVHRLVFKFEVRLTEPHFRRTLQYERTPRNRRMPAFLMVRRLIERRQRK